MSYQEFLSSKRIDHLDCGLEPKELNGSMFPFQKAITRWALKKGRAAIFADCGLGKTLMQLEWANQIPGRVLILAPLAVAQQTALEAVKFGIGDVNYCRSDNGSKITVANYEMLDRFDAHKFDAVVLDESSILKAFDGKTRTELIETFSKTPMRLCCTATPAPNDFMELGNHAEFLGVMTRSEMLSMFFVHDGGETQKWRLKGHAEKEFWRWICSWAVNIRKPSDIGFDDAGYNLPKLFIEQAKITSTKIQEGFLFPMEAQSLQERIKARSASVDDRAKLAAQIILDTPSRQWLVWCNLNSEADAIKKLLPEAIEVRGSDKPETKQERLLDFAAGKIKILISKPSIAGFGMNFQNCSDVLFLGLSDSYEEFYQAIRRCWRFGQKNDVWAWVVTSSTEGAVVKNIERKEADAKRLADEMVSNMSDISKGEIMSTSRTESKYATDVKQGLDWTMLLGDSIEVVKEMATDSIHYSIFSPPFSSLYTYSNSERDLGNCTNDAIFMEHFGFLIAELFRVIKPGRLLSFHCMNLPTSKTHHGYIGIRDFRGDLIRLFQSAGFIFHSEVCIWKDPVTAMQRTKAIGLLYKQLRKDSAISRQGIPDYLVTMRKPGENDEPVTKTHESFPVALWQRYASPVWMDINPSDTLQFRSAREHNDEKHICPLQLQVIQRAVELWTNPGDVVLSPFAGIGSEGYQSLKLGRKFIGVELKESYYKQACKNLAAAKASIGTLFNQEVEDDEMRITEGEWV